ncbi:elongation factor P isoform X3 [Capsicum annuum]|uniref:elongation factor P isoform X3 n=1 Tax=Capsicum annuum TaxID=4072 RepID=UPI0007BF9713|nr:elongation factor P isoform X3 [Capsicum annuum]
MGVVAKRLSRALWSAAFSSSACGSTISRALSTCIQSKNCPYNQSLFSSAWSATQRRGVKSRGSDLKPGNVIEKKGRIYQVVKAQHTTQGRGGAIIQVELRDVDSGSKSNERIRTDETVENEWSVSLDIIGLGCAEVFVTEKSFTYLYTDEETGNIVLMEPETYEQLDVPKHLFGECYVYLQDDMEVHVQLYDERAMSASIPKRVTCTVAESEIPMRASATPQYKKVLLDNGLTVQVPKHVVEGDRIIVNTTNHSYVSRA